MCCVHFNRQYTCIKSIIGRGEMKLRGLSTVPCIRARAVLSNFVNTCTAEPFARALSFVAAPALIVLGNWSLDIGRLTECSTINREQNVPNRIAVASSMFYCECYAKRQYDSDTVVSHIISLALCVLLCSDPRAYDGYLCCLKNNCVVFAFI